MAVLDDSSLSHLYQLARIKEEQDPTRRAKLLSDLEAVLGYAQELREVDTSSVKPMAGGTLLTNVYRDDSERILNDTERSDQRTAIVEEFPDHQNDYVKVPGVFE